MENKSFLGIGSNIGNRLNNIKNAVSQISHLEKTVILETSSVYFTEPFGVKEQDEFLNIVISISTNLKLRELFKGIKEIEENIGREQTFRWGPRKIDIDILFYGELLYSDEVITVPHKGILERDFVIEPLLEIDPDIIHPGLNKKLADYDRSEIEKTIIRKEKIDLHN
jgi:2-amino-4-hydroxy-6-hydroxymethyldihydropteridine diphosphokinase